MAVLPVALILGALAGGCASIGHPEGGPKDELPPVFVGATPPDGALNVTTKRFRLHFDENIQLKDIQNNIIVSPAQKRMPKFNGNGNVVTVELDDSLRDSTTYTFDFGSAIVDLNEGNILDGFAYAFSTGPTIDTLAISGMVFEAANLEPAQAMLVGAYKADVPDSAITTMALDRVTRTNQYGQFILRNLAEGSYRLYALGDVNGDYHWDRSENIAFLGEAVTPRTEMTEMTDSITTADGRDSVVTRPVVTYLPNDLILTWFNEDYRPSYLAKYERTDTARISLIFNAPMDSMPELTIVAPEGALAPLDGRRLSDWGVADISAGRDSIDIWISDPAVIASDSLYVAARFMKTDTASQLIWATDTVRLFVKKGMRGKASAPSSKKRARGKDLDLDTLAPSVPSRPTMKATLAATTQQLNLPLRVKLDRPVAYLDSSAVTLEMKAEGDSSWTRAEGFTLGPGRKLLELEGSPVEWVSGASYKLSIDTAAMASIYGEPLAPFKGDFKARKRDEYSSIILNISGTDGRPAIAQLLNKSDQPVASAPVDRAGRAIFEYLEPGTYYARLFFDDNQNGKYDTGRLLDSIQPEEVAYYPKKLNLKKNWDMEQSWDIYETPLDQQKHSDIKKNKPKTKDGKDAGTEEDEEAIEYDEFGRPVNAGQYRNPFGSSSGSGRSSGGLKRGGFQNASQGGQIR